LELEEEKDESGWGSALTVVVMVDDEAMGGSSALRHQRGCQAKNQDINGFETVKQNIAYLRHSVGKKGRQRIMNS